MKKQRPIELPTILSVRVRQDEYQHLMSLAQTGRRTLSQTVRLLLETALRESEAA